MKHANPRPGQIDALTVLGLIFFTLKLAGLIDWPWLWVTAPFWIPFAVLGLGFVSFALLWVGLTAFKKMRVW